VSVFAPNSGDAGTAWCPCSRSFSTEPMSPLPPTTMTFIGGPSLASERVDAAVGRRREFVVAGLAQFLDELGSDEAGSADHDDRIYHPACRGSE
jgi:hypothetical protein